MSQQTADVKVWYNTNGATEYASKWINIMELFTAPCSVCGWKLGWAPHLTTRWQLTPVCEVIYLPAKLLEFVIYSKKTEIKRIKSYIDILKQTNKWINKITKTQNKLLELKMKTKLNKKIFFKIVIKTTIVWCLIHCYAHPRYGVWLNAV